MKKQSSIEWFASRLLSELGLTIEDTKTDNPKLYDLIQQSKEMHKQEIVSSYFDGYTTEHVGYEKTITEYSNDYYMKTYESKH